MKREIRLQTVDLFYGSCRLSKPPLCQRFNSSLRENINSVHLVFAGHDLMYRNFTAAHREIVF
jgi:hypothetical protein